MPEELIEENHKRTLRAAGRAGQRDKRGHHGNKHLGRHHRDDGDALHRQGKAQINKIRNQAVDGDLHRGEKSRRKIELERASHDSGALVEHGQLRVNPLVALNGTAHNAHPVQQAQDKAQDAIRPSRAHGEGENGGNKRAVGQQADHGDKGKIADIGLEKAELGRDKNQGIEHHYHLIHQRFHRDDAARLAGIEPHLVHGVNLHRLSSGRKRRDGAVKQARHAHGERPPEAPPGADVAAEQIQREALQQKRRPGGHDRQREPLPPQAHHNLSEILHASVGEQKIQDKNHRDRDRQNREQIPFQLTRKIQSHPKTSSFHNKVSFSSSLNAFLPPAKSFGTGRATSLYTKTRPGRKGKEQPSLYHSFFNPLSTFSVPLAALPPFVL